MRIEIGEFGGSTASDEAKSQAGLKTIISLYVMNAALLRFFDQKHFTAE
jgi:hypothetical protein